MKTDDLTEADVDVIDAAIEDVAPELPVSINTQCAECGGEHLLPLVLNTELIGPVTELLDDVHELAVNYHWSEQEILALPQRRRAQYLERLDRERGLGGARP